MNENRARRAVWVLAATVAAVWATCRIAEAFVVKEMPLALVSAPILTVLAILGFYFARAGAVDLVDRLAAPATRNPARSIVVLAVVCLGLLLVLARVGLDAFPTSADEYAYILQAKTYALGRLWADPPPIADAFRQLRVPEKAGMWISAYQPGWPALLSLAERVGAALWIVNPLVGAASLAVFFAVARTRVSDGLAWLATLALATSAFFLLNLASYFAHGFAALAGLLFVLGGRKYLASLDLRWALAAGAALGVLGLTRTFNAAVFALPFVVALMMRPARWRGLVAFGLGGLPFLALLLAYNGAITGDPLIPVQSWVQGEPLGAPGASSSLFSVSRIVRLYLWTSPALVLGTVAAFVLLWRRRRLDFADWIMPATLFAFVFYGGDGAVQYGPRYLFEAWPPMILTAVSGLAICLEEADRPKRRAWAAAALLAHLAFQVGYAIPRVEREHRIALDRQQIYHAVEAARLEKAVVFVAGASGSIRPLERHDLARNGLVIGDEPVTYAWDLGPVNAEVMRLFPGRRAYAWADGRLEPLDATTLTADRGAPPPP